LRDYFLKPPGEPEEGKQGSPLGSLFPGEFKKRASAQLKSTGVVISKPSRPPTVQAKLDSELAECVKKNHDLQKALKLIQKGANPNFPVENGKTLLHLAAEMGDSDAINDLFLQGASHAVKDMYSRTPIHYAAFNAGEDAFSLLLLHGADLDAKSMSGSTALHFAAFNSNSKVFEKVLNHFKDANVVDDEGQTPLHLLANLGSNEKIERLLAHGANPNAIDWEGETPLHVAARANRDDAVRTLLAAKADPNIANEHGYLPKTYANAEISSLLESKTPQKPASKTVSKLTESIMGRILRLVRKK